DDPAHITAPTVLRPTLSFPAGVSIDGHPFYDDYPAMGVTPTVSWSPPLHGTPTWYTLVVSELVGRPIATPRRTDAVTVATIVTRETSFAIQPDMLQIGHVYVFQLSAVDSGGNVDAPFRLDRRQMTTGAPSGVLTP